MSARDDVLARIRSAYGPQGPPVERLTEVADRARAAARAAAVTVPPEAVIERFAERVGEYQATVQRVGPDEVAAVVDRLLRAAGAASVIVPEGLPADWCAHPGARRDLDHAGALELDEVDAVVTGCAVAIAETGTIVLDAGPGQGRRALTLVPDHHVCVVLATRIVADVTAGLAMVDPNAPLTLISGPSATSDIELDRVEGVHGPRRLDVVVIG